MKNKIQANNTEIAYRDRGEGKAIIFLHAFPLSQIMWDDQIDQLSTSHRVITFDWRGFGDSRLGDGIASLDLFADDLAALMDGLSIQKATICGLSMGGYAALAFFRRHGHRIEKLILADTRATTDTEEGRRGRFETAEAVRLHGVEVIIETMLPRLVGETSLKNRHDVCDKVRSMIKSADPETVAQALIAMAGRSDSSELLAEIKIPTLIIVGSEDKLTPPVEAEFIRQGIPNSQMCIINGAGHLPNMESPADFNLAIANFLK